MFTSGAPTNVETTNVETPNINVPNHPSTSPAWQSTGNYRNGIRTSGSGNNQQYYKWDFEHGGEIEVHNRRGEHIGVMDPNTGAMTKPALPGRDIKDKL